MHYENIAPAICGVAPEQMSSQQFQEKLYAWFQDKGLLADLRSYLRLQMIRKLRNTSIGKVEPAKTTFSLSEQAFNLIVAEHLLRQGCHYTLSIFSTEVPSVANQMPCSFLDAGKCTNQWRFDEESVDHLLELLGIKKTSPEGASIATLYYKNAGSLLSCMVLKQRSNVDVASFNTTGENVVTYLEQTLSNVGFNRRLISDISAQIQAAIDAQVKKNRKLYDNKIEELMQQIADRDSHIRRLIDDQVVVNKQLKQLQSDLKKSQKRTNELLLKEDAVKMKEQMLKEKFDDLSNLEKELKAHQQCTKPHCSQECQTSALLADKLRTEVDNLQDINKQNLVEMERTNSKCVLLANDLKSSRAKIDLLQACLAQSSEINLSQKSDTEADVSDDSSDHLTDEILQQVRLRLENLEKESEELDSRFHRLGINT